MEQRRGLPRAQPEPAIAPHPAGTAESSRSGPGDERPTQRRHGVGFVVAAVAAVLLIAVALVLVDREFLFHTRAGTAFLSAFPGSSPLPAWVPIGFPLWTQWQHWLNAFFIVLIIKTGWTIRRQKKPSATWQPRRGRGTKIGIELWTHLSLDLLWLTNGVIFCVLLFATGQWARIVPTSWGVFPNAVSAALQYASLAWPTSDGWSNYNALQLLTYFVTVFIAAPLAAVTGFRMSPLWPTKARHLSRAYPVRLARAIHFPVMVYFVVFVIVHVTLVLATGALRNLNHMFWGSDDANSWAGFWVFVVGIAVIIGGTFGLRSFIMQHLGAIFGRVGR